MNLAPATGGRFALACGSLPPETVIQASIEAEERGYETVWLGESGLEPDAFVLTAAVLAATSRVHAGPGIASAADRHPVALVRGASTLDQLFPGRVVLGIGRGDAEATAAATGLTTREAGPALEDAVRICRPLLRGHRVDHNGHHWSAHVGPPPRRTAASRPIPLAMAAVGPRTLRLAGELADLVLLNYGAPPEYIPWARERIAEGATASGRDPGTVEVHGFLLLARTDLDDGGAALRQVSDTLAGLFSQAAQSAALAAPAGGLPERWDEAACRRFAAVGTLDECLARIEEYRRAGLQCVILLPSGMRALARGA
jgi:5,10-methylenetetrahydromethanopterin reductase